MNPQEEREQKVFARIGRLVFLADEQTEALIKMQETLSHFEAFLNEKNLRNEFNNFVSSRNGAPLGDTEAAPHDKGKTQ